MVKGNIYKEIVHRAFCKALECKAGDEYKILQELCNTIYTLLPQQATLWEGLADDYLQHLNKLEREDLENLEEDDDDPLMLPEDQSGYDTEDYQGDEDDDNS